MRARILAGLLAVTTSVVGASVASATAAPLTVAETQNDVVETPTSF